MALSFMPPMGIARARRRDCQGLPQEELLGGIVFDPESLDEWSAHGRGSRNLSPWQRDDGKPEVFNRLHNLSEVLKIYGLDDVAVGMETIDLQKVLLVL